MSISMLLCACAGSLQAPAQSPSQVRIYDLHAIAPLYGASAGVQFFPLTDPEWESSQGQELAQPDFDFAYELLTRLMAPEFDLEGKRQALLENGRMLIEGSTAVHEGVARTLRNLEKVCAEPVLFSVDVIAWPAGQGEWPASTLLPESAALALVEAARGSRAALSSWRLALRPGEIGTIDARQSVPLVADFDVEIAQFAFIADPVVRTQRMGLFLQLAAAPGKSGTYLALAAVNNEWAQPMRESKHRVGGLLISDKQVQDYSSEVLVQAADGSHRSFGLNTFLPEGQVLALPVDYELERGGVRQIMLVRRLGPAGKASVVLEASTPKSGRVLLWNRSANLPPRCVLELGEEPLVGASLVSGSYEELPWDLFIARLPGGEDAWSPLESGVWLALLEQRSTSAGLSVAALDGLPSADERVIHVDYVLAGPNLSSIARGGLPLRAGEPSLAVLGLESTAVRDVDVEVASNSATNSLEVRSEFEGLRLSLHPRILADGGLTLEVDVLASIRSSADQRFQPDQQGLFGVDQVRHQRLASRQVLRFAAGAPAKAVLGDSANGLQLSLEARW